MIYKAKINYYCIMCTAPYISIVLIIDWSMVCEPHLVSASGYTKHFPGREGLKRTLQKCHSVLMTSVRFLLARVFVGEVLAEWLIFVRRATAL